MLAAVEVHEIIIVVVYLLVVGYLGWLGFRRTQTATDYLVAGRKIHPFVMAMSYGATFISTSAIVGFGGVAGLFGMSLLWLTFLNIFVGIFVAFVFLGGPTRRMGHRLDAHTFPELLGRRYDSKFVQVFAGLIIFFFIPLYAAAVLIGGSEFIVKQLGLDYNTALLVFAVLIAAYVVLGGLKGVMYTDALQGTIMTIGMLILLIWTYSVLGGISSAHQELGSEEMTGQVFAGFKAMGHQGWTSMPEFGWGEKSHELWWIVISTIVMGVGIGVLAQPQLAVRFMTVRSKRELNRAVLVGGIFILLMTGVAFTVGSLSNLYFYKHEKVEGTLVRVTGVGSKPTEWEWVVAKKERGMNLDAEGNLKNKLVGPDEVCLPCVLLHVDTDDDGDVDTRLIYKGYGKARPLVPAAEIAELAEGQDVQSLAGKHITVHPRATAFTRAVAMKGGKYELIADSIIPTFITSALPGWFGLLFLLTLLAAAMSTLSSQFHALGTSIGRDVYEQVTGRHGRSIGVTRVGIIIGIAIAVLISFSARGGYIIARATAIFFGLCASAFLPTFVGGLFSKRVTRAGAKASMITGFVVTAFWLVCMKDKEARALGICKALFDRYSLTVGNDGVAASTWHVVDPMFVALPLSVIALIVVSLFTSRSGDEHLAKCFPGKAAD
jgi:SSS family solute:Na+ symporter